MKTFTVAIFCLTVAAASASHLGFAGHGGYGHVAAPINPAALIPSGSISVGANGAVVAGPAGSVATDNGLGGHGAGARLSGPAGDVRTHGGHAVLSGPGFGGDGGHSGHGGYGAGLGAGFGLGAGHGFGHGAIIAAPIATSWGHGGFVGGSHLIGGAGLGGHGLLGHGHAW